MCLVAFRDGAFTTPSLKRRQRRYVQFTFDESEAGRTVSFTKQSEQLKGGSWKAVVTSRMNDAESLYGWLSSCNRQSFNLSLGCLMLLDDDA